MQAERGSAASARSRPKSGPTEIAVGCKFNELDSDEDAVVAVHTVARVKKPHKSRSSWLVVDRKGVESAWDYASYNRVIAVAKTAPWTWQIGFDAVEGLVVLQVELTGGRKLDASSRRLVVALLTRYDASYKFRRF